ncbi:ABC transporter permease [Pedobacter gandavensis]|uniref:FtsX-like permease family protein n=1 Tax=Pedobacter gandavensis TaxID=2679963 RepID=A0ABR6EYG4_9SPHI|nr:ABC transporter permease [Pedobacter gandavensis]MBB2150072.1 FtsX-like permease family protein [Pedobacter gandavensis]
MLKHLFKLIWNKKKENFLLISEILISFMVIFAVFTLLVYNYQNYAVPKGFEEENVWSVDLGELNVSKNKDSVGVLHENLRNVLKNLPEVKAISYASANVPFSNSMFTSGTGYKGIRINVDVNRVEDDYKQVLGLSLLSGRWFSPEDNGLAKSTVILNEEAKERLFGKEDAIGKMISDGSSKVIGVIQNLKDKSDFKAPMPAIYTRIDTGKINQMNQILVRVAPGTTAAFEGKMYKMIASTIKSTNLEIKHLSDMKAEKNKETIIPMIIFFIVTGFLIINVALGIFGVLWYNINKRRAEIGLRRAIGATSSAVSTQLLGEALVIATFSLIIGSFFAVQFPLMKVFDLPTSVYLLAQFFAILFIYLLVVICALYPGKQAAAIYPAVALHEE